MIFREFILNLIFNKKFISNEIFAFLLGNLMTFRENKKYKIKPIYNSKNKRKELLYFECIKGISQIKKRYYFFRKQTFLTLSNGLKKRSIEIGTSYNLNTINFHPNSLIIDCGANVGDLQLYLDFACKDYKYIGIEPGEKEFLCLKKNTTKNHLLINKALGEKEGEMTFYYKPEFADSSLVEMNEFESKKIIKVTTLNKIIEEYLKPNQRVRLLKLEAEGYEPEILLGALNALERIDFISADVGFERGLKNESTIAECTNILLKNGFKMIKINEKNLRVLYEKI